jgi:predicted neuraminidase
MSKKVFLATIRIAIDAEACGGTVDGACEWMSGLLSDNNDVFDWAYGTSKTKFPTPELIEFDDKNYQEGDLFTKPLIINRGE